MKKRFFSIILAIVLSFTCLGIFTGCFGGGPPQVLDETTWQDYFDEVRFSLSGDKYQGYLGVAPNSYVCKGVAYGKNLDFKGQHYDYYTVGDGDEVTACEAADYVDYSLEFKPFFDFMHDNFNNFVMHVDPTDEGYQYFVYDGELSQDLKNSIVKMMRKSCTTTNADSIEYNYHSLVLWANYSNVNRLCFMDGDYEFDSYDFTKGDSVVAHMFDLGEYEDHARVQDIIYQEQEAANYLKIQDSIKSVSTCVGENVNFVVKGGKGVDYQEFYFTDKGMRLYTPNAEQPQIYGDSNIYVDGIYYNDNGTYTYYKKTKEGVWSSQTIDKDRFESTLLQFYMIYCGGGKWLTAQSIRGMGFDFSTSTLTYAGEFTDQTSFRPYYDGRQYSIKYTFANEVLTKVTWKLDMIPTSLAETMGAKKLTYDFTLTVGGASITLPNA